MPSGDDLPVVPGFPGGVVAFLRNQAITARSAVRDVPPHMESRGPVVQASTIGLMYGDRDVLTGDVFAVSSFPPIVYDTNPTTRSRKDTSSRFNPLQHPDLNKTKNREPKPLPLVPVTQAPKLPKPTDARVSIPPPTNPINQREGWQESLPSKRPSKETDVQMGEELKRPSGPSYHFTSDVQEKANPLKVYDLIMNTMVSVPVYEVLGNSPPLQKLFADSTRTRRLYTSKPAEYVSSVTLADVTDEDDLVVAQTLCASNFDRFPGFLVWYSNAIAAAANRKFYWIVYGTY